VGESVGRPPVARIPSSPAADVIEPSFFDGRLCERNQLAFVIGVAVSNVVHSARRREPALSRRRKPLPVRQQRRRGKVARRGKDPVH